MTNEELAAAVQRGEDQDGSLLMELWNSNQSYIHAILKRYDGLVEESDLQQEAFIGLMEAVGHWDSERGVPFMVYAGHWIRAAVGRYIQQECNIPINKQEKIWKLHRVESDFQQMHGREPSNAELSNLLNLSVNEVLEIRKAEIAQNKLYLDELKSSDDGEEYTIADLTPGAEDPEADAVDHYQQEQLAAVVWDEVDALPKSEAEVLHKRFQQEKQLSEIAAESGRSVAQVEGDQRKGLTKLRTDPKSRRRLLPFLDDEIRSGSLRGCGVSRFNSTWSSSTERTALKMVEKSTDSSR